MCIARAPARGLAIAVLGLVACLGPDRGEPPSETVTGVADTSGAVSASSEETGDSSSGPSGSETDAIDESSGDSSDGAIFDVGSWEETDGVGVCSLPELVPCDGSSDDPLNAMGVGCPGNNGVQIGNEFFTSADPGAWAVASQYGTHLDGNNEPTWGAKEGEKMLIVSSGTVPPPDANGVVTNTFTAGNLSTSNANPDGVTPLPPPFSIKKGSNNGMGGDPFQNCDFVNDCSDTLFDQWVIGLGANDMLTFGFDLVAPPDAHGYEFDFAWFSSEYPEWVGSAYNDMLVVWSTSETYTGNITFIGDQPLTVTALAEHIHDDGFSGDDPELEGTGFGGTHASLCSGYPPYDWISLQPCPWAGASGWFTAKGSTTPGELFSLTYAIFDMSDTVLDTLALIDNWHWTCEGCDPMDEECGVAPK